MDSNVRWNDNKILTFNGASEESPENVEDQIECEIFKKKKYMSNKPYKKFLNSSYTVISLAVAVFMLIIIIIINSTTKNGTNDNNLLISGGSSGKVLIKDSINETHWSSTTIWPTSTPKTNSSLTIFMPELILCDDMSLWSYNPKNKNINILQKMKNLIGSFDLDLNKTMFWIEKNTSKILSSTKRALNATHNHYFTDIILKEPKFKPEAIALDYFTQKLYAIDKSIGFLIAIDIQTKQYGIVLTDLNKPKDIFLDPAQGLLFIQESNSILNGNMDGSNTYRIVNNEKVTAITIDLKFKKIYWINDWTTIVKMDYDGQNSEIILESHVRVISLATIDEKLFWLWSAHDKSNATLWSCDIHDSDCENQKIEQITLHNITQIKTYHKVSKNHACEHDNGKCQQLCLLTSIKKGGLNCACYLGWQLTSDPRSCKLNKDFILYYQNNFIRGRVLDVTKLSGDMILSTRLYTESQLQDNIDFDYDLINDDLFFNDDTHIYITKLKIFKDQKIMLNCTSKSNHPCKIKYITYDWLSKNLYYVEFVGYAAKIMMFNTKSTKLKTLSTESITTEIIVYPSKGYFLYGSRYNMFVNLVNGTQLSKTNPGANLNHFSMDFQNNLIYLFRKRSILVDTYTFIDMKIEYSKQIRFQSEIYSPFIYDRWIYFSTNEGIKRFDILDDKIDKLTQRMNHFTPGEFRMKVFSPDIQFLIKDNPCDIDNGGCEQFCFYAPEKNCGCEDDQRLQNNSQCV